MRRLAIIALIIFLAFTLIACGKSTSEPVEEMINPGDIVDGCSIRIAIPRLYQ